MLARNEDLGGAIHTIQSLEARFNRWFHYPYVFLNDQAFDDTFIKSVSEMVSGPVHFGTVPPAMWGFPAEMDEMRAKAAMKEQGDHGVKYGALESYHHMCRFFAGLE